MKKTTPISNLMTTKIVAISPNDTMDLAEGLFEEYGIHHLPVVKNGNLVGIVSQTDLLKIVRQIFGDPIETRKNNEIKASLTAQEIMSKNVVCLRPSDTLGDAVRIFRDNQFHALPVTEGPENHLLGIVTTTDMLRFLEKMLNDKEVHGLVM